MTVPDELVQAVHDASRVERRIRVGRAEGLTIPSVFDAVYVLGVVPDGWRKRYNGEWVHDDFCEHGVLGGSGCSECPR